MPTQFRVGFYFRRELHVPEIDLLDELVNLRQVAQATQIYVRVFTLRIFESLDGRDC